MYKILIVLLLILLAIPLASATTLDVNKTGWWKNGGSFNESVTPIQAAISNSSDGDIIFVHIGIYNETLNIENRNNLDFVGENKATTIIKSTTSLDWGNVLGGSYGATRQTMVRIVNSTNINFSNFTFNFTLMKTSVPGISYVSGLWYWSSSGIVNNNILKNISMIDNASVAVTSQEHTIYVRAMIDGGYNHTNRANVDITNNEFINTGRVGINSHDYVNINITDNLFHKDPPYDGSGGYDLGWGIELGSESIGVIISNTLYGYEGGEFYDSAGIYVENAFTYDVPYPFTKYVTVRGNEVYNSTQGAIFGCLSSWHGDVAIIINFSDNNIHDNRLKGVLVVDNDMIDGSSVTVNAMNNIITNNGDYGYRIYTNGDGNITFSAINEIITNHNYGLQVEDSTASTSVYSVTIRNSNIYDNTIYGIYNNISTLITATDNWWGSSTGPGGEGPGTGDNVSGNINYDSWLSTPTWMPTPASILISARMIGTTEDHQVSTDAAGASWDSTRLSGAVWNYFEGASFWIVIGAFVILCALIILISITLISIKNHQKVSMEPIIGAVVMGLFLIVLIGIIPIIGDSLYQTSSDIADDYNTATLTLTANATAGQIVNIGSEAYTYTNGTGGAFNVDIGTDQTPVFVSSQLIDEINANSTLVTAE